MVFSHRGRQFFFITLTLKGRPAALSQLVDAESEPALLPPSMSVKSRDTVKHQARLASGGAGVQPPSVRRPSPRHLPARQSSPYLPRPLLCGSTAAFISSSRLTRDGSRPNHWQGSSRSCHVRYRHVMTHRPKIRENSHLTACCSSQAFTTRRQFRRWPFVAKQAPRINSDATVSHSTTSSPTSASEHRRCRFDSLFRAARIREGYNPRAYVRKGCALLRDWLEHLRGESLSLGLRGGGRHGALERRASQVEQGRREAVSRVSDVE